MYSLNLLIQDVGNNAFVSQWTNIYRQNQEK
jgi:hypothetical protein